MRTLLCVVAVLVVAAPVAAQTYVTDDILVPTTWTPAGSPYIIQDDIVVWAALTIQSSPSGGVAVEFDGYYRVATQLNGHIVAEGNADHNVLFTSHAVSPAPFDWSRLDISEPLSSFSYCTFEYAWIAIRANGSSPTISHCTFRFCRDYAIWCYNGSPTVQHCDIHDNEIGFWLHCDGYQSHPVINHCNFYDNTYYNLKVVAYPEPLVVIDAQNNWWGTDVEAEIQAGIYDSSDDAAIYATVDYDPWLHEVPVEATSWGRLKALFAE